MHSNQIIRYSAVFLLLLFVATMPSRAQQTIPSLSLSQAVDSALQRNHLLKIKEYQLKEKKAGIKKAKIKHFPSVTVSSTYRYNKNTASLDIQKGEFGSLPLSPSVMIPLPNADKSFELLEHENFKAGVSLYQPISEQPKIYTGVQVSQTEASMAGVEKHKAKQQITLSVEKLYYGILINQKKQEQAKAKLELAKMKLHDTESAIQAGKMVDANKAALKATVADKKQELLKLKIEAQDHRSDFERLTGMSLAQVKLQNVENNTLSLNPLASYKSEASNHNVDLQLASLKQKKSRLAIKAARENYIPNLGFIAGYSYQKGSTIYPTYNPYVGIHFEWNLQDIFSDKQIVEQRKNVYQQAREHWLNMQEKVDNEVEKAYRKLTQIESLIETAQKAVSYRRQAYRIQKNKQDAGLNTKADLLNARADLTKSQADLYAAQLQYQLALSKLRIVTEGKDRFYQ